jgi:hypothetical protein
MGLPENSFREFVGFLRRNGYTEAQVRGEVPMPQELLELADRIPGDRFEKWCGRVIREKLLYRNLTQKVIQEIVNDLVIEFGPSFLSRPDSESILSEAGLDRNHITDLILERASEKAKEYIGEIGSDVLPVVVEGDLKSDPTARLGWGTVPLDQTKVESRLQEAEDLERRLKEEKDRKAEETRQRLEELRKSIEEISKEDGDVIVKKKRLVQSRSDKRLKRSGSGKHGSVLVRKYKGKEYRVLVGKEGFVLDGETYRSLTAVAEKIVGRHISGPEFFKS